MSAVKLPFSMSNNNALGPSTSMRRNQFISQLLSDDHEPPSLLPSELIWEILLRLPVKSLSRFKCVCKSWKFIISNTHFVKMHLHLSTLDPTLTRHHVLLSTSTSAMSCSINSILYNLSTTPYENVNFSFDYQIMGCCNGIMCMLEYHNKTHACLWNPSARLASRKSHPIMHDGILACHGFGYDYISDKYKMVFSFLDPIVKNKTIAKVYAFGENSWRPIHNLSLLNYKSLTNEPGIFVGGSDTLNWMTTRIGEVTTNPHVILSFDLRKETFEEVLLPDFGPDNPPYPFPTTLKDCLCVCYEYKQTHLVVWLMKEYGVKESWTKLMKIPHWELGILELQVLGITPFVAPFYMSDNGEVLVYNSFVRGGALVYYSKDDRLELRKLHSHDNTICLPYIFIESLISPCF